MTQTPDSWPDPADSGLCRSWLDQVWSRSDLADAIRQASPTLAHRVEGICSGRVTQAKHVRRATIATARYVLRATGRPTPFGLFAGVARASVGSTASVRWGTDHRPVARVDTEWLASAIERLESCAELLERLNVVFNNLATRRGGRLQVPYGGPNIASIRYTSAIRMVWDIAAAPIRFSALVEKVTATLPGATRSKVCKALTELVRKGFLITDLRPPLTVTDPLDYLIERLHEVEAGKVPTARPLLDGLEDVRAGLDRHNAAEADEQGHARERIARRMGGISQAGRTPLTVDLLLDCDVRLPHQVAHELERAASALLCLTRQPAGEAVSRDFHVAFWERYGVGTLVPVTEVVDPAAGIGYPAQYPGSMMTSPPSGPTQRDERLLALAWQAAVDGSGETLLTDEMIREVTDGDQFDERHIPPHVEMCARVHAISTEALQRGEFTLTVTPARSAGTLTSRFTLAATGSGLAQVYRDVPAATEGALPAQLSFPPLYPHTENVCRIPAYLPHVISLAEHPASDDAVTTIALDDLAVTATRDRLHLVSISRRQVIEPQVFHAMALEKQPPPVARFLAHLSRGFSTAWTGFDWGPHAARLPCLGCAIGAPFSPRPGGT